MSDEVGSVWCLGVPSNDVMGELLSDDVYKTCVLIDDFGQRWSSIRMMLGLSNHVDESRGS